MESQNFLEETAWLKFVHKHLSKRQNLESLRDSFQEFSRLGLARNEPGTNGDFVIDCSLILNCFTVFCTGVPNGLRYLHVGGRGFCLGAGKTRSEENT